jgi:hypothetical protein
VLCSHDLFILDKHTSDVCVWGGGGDNKYLLVCRVAKDTSRGYTITMTRKIFEKCTLVRVFAGSTSRGIRKNYSLGSLLKPKALALLPDRTNCGNAA